MKHNTTILRLIVVVVALAAVTGAVAPGMAVAQSDSPPEPPHRVYGDVTDGNDDAAAGVTVEITHDGSVVASATTDADGVYSIDVEGLDDGDEITVTAAGSSVTDSDPETLAYSTASSDRVDLTVSVDDDDGTGGDGSDGDDGTDGDDGSDGDDGTDGDDGDDDGGDGGDGGTGGGGGGGGGAGDGGDTTTPSPEPVTNVEGNAQAETSVNGQTVTVSITGAAAGDSVETAFDQGTVDRNLAETGAALNGLTKRFAASSDFSADITYSRDNPSADAPDLEESIGANTFGHAQVDHDAPDDALEGATFRFSVRQDRLDDTGITAEDVSLYRYNDGEWEEYEASVDEEGDNRVTFTADSPGLSTFAIGQSSDTVEDGSDGSDGGATDGSDGGDTDGSDGGDTNGGDDGSDDGIPGFGPLVALVALVAAALLATRRDD
ncbi:hypothetical protein DJ69_07705 [Halorubrum persicum]|uniref:PGF-CTERM archaeal protein-sorting signal domain-containing protein n=1 Tax=Halorubrum persicum TaxID=1383844 RepID=A0A2G1WJI9_9EURY|nr:PGF-pre-PGF domain-containing protein [Halorubrum persicum]PHQ39150.1 hypothetical protein DJ69_07705 [Halorubrum persicum]